MAPEKLATIYVLADSRIVDQVKRVRYVGRTWEQVEAIRRRYEAGGVSQHQLARDYSVMPRTINLIVHRKTWVAA